MESLALVRKYVSKVCCGHCGGSGKCKCDSCRRDKHSIVMFLWKRIHSLLPHEEGEEKAREAYQKAYWEESEREEKAIASEGICFKCGGEKTVRVSG